ncbi:NAD(P)-dependent oxidoreductase [Streptomyces sp. NPDC092369]|uniref:NAD(P)-dependent oxidoreductase n=1 Tax=Streptomyces sp. NPDC092369 TaxID=3366015 RepID=UPI0038205550
MRITVFGASGSVGSVLVPEALHRGHEIIAVTRDPSRIALRHTRLTVVIAELGDGPGLEKALFGAQAVIISLGDAVCDTGTGSILAAMRNAGVRRVQVLTAFGTSEISRRQLGRGMRGVLSAVRLVARAAFSAKERQDALVRASGVQYTIVQPPTLTFGPPTGAYRHGDYRGKSILGKISRADLAHFMLDNLEQDRYLDESVYVQN